MARNDGWEHLESDKPTLYKEWVDHFSQKQPGPELLLADTLRERYPGYAIVSTTSFFNVFSFPEVRLTPVHGFEPPVVSVGYSPPARRGEGPGTLSQDVRFAALKADWRGESFTVVTAEWREGYATLYHTSVLRRGGAEAEQVIKTFLTAVWAFANELHDEILVFNEGFWNKDKALWNEVQKASWEDVILDEQLKSQVQNDVDNFFKSEKVYKNLAVPWKRGIIMLGPPGNGKTISVKAIMKTSKAPSLYVKSFQSYRGPEASIRDVFKRARAMAPCLLILEDLDSLIDDKVRSFFLNELDGLEGNDGILLIGTTNHFDRLDPGLSNRPSRFDRKFLFDNPTMSERIMYCQYWRKKLASNKSIRFPKELVEHVASITEDFSFAYLKEAFVSTLVSIATGTETDPFSEALERQIKQLRDQIEQSMKFSFNVSPSPENAITAPSSPSRWFGPTDM